MLRQIRLKIALALKYGHRILEDVYDFRNGLTAFEGRHRGTQDQRRLDAANLGNVLRQIFALMTCRVVSVVNRVPGRRGHGRWMNIEIVNPVKTRTVRPLCEPTNELTSSH